MEQTVNQRIKIIFNDQKVSMRAFANSIDSTSTTINRIIEGKNNPGFDTISSIAKVYNVNPDWLLLGNGETYIDGKVSNSPKSNESKEISFAAWKHLEDEVLYLREMLRMAMGNMANFPNSPQQVGKVLPLFMEGAFAGDYQLAG